MNVMRDERPLLTIRKATDEERREKFPPIAAGGPRIRVPKYVCVGASDSVWTVFGLPLGGDTRAEAVYWAERTARASDRVGDARREAGVKTAAAMQLCDEVTGMVGGEWLAQHNRLALAAGHEPTVRPFVCTGDACYVAGEFVRCSSAFHAKKRPAPVVVCNRRDGIALVRTVSDVREHFDGDPGVPQDFWDDLATIERVGRHLYSAQTITLPITFPAGSRA